MPDYQHPSELEPRLSRAHLDVVCNNLLDSAYKALEATSTEDDTNWTKGIFPYGRIHGRFKRLHRDDDLPWFKLVNNTLDYTISIDGVLMQVVTDDPDVRKKAYRVDKNVVELYHDSLLGPAEDGNVTWRLYVDSDRNPDGPKLTVSILGFDTNRNVISKWIHNYEPLVSVRTTELSPVVEIDDSLPVRRDKDAAQKETKDADLKDE
ncbi:hypothetical protein [Pseudomonas putida]|uniref:hypothetical protein n=1 Tax=Pseudomonas putida TaxID=303 RepID=UPI000281DF8C|nr:hypothetical protein [Pseudomonas putida]EMR47975.1 hypothetical protein PPUTLS46_009034 [Pseudomonas putida LS46]